MVRFRIFKTLTYDEDYEELDKSEKMKVDNLIEELFENGDKVGKPLGTHFFREKKFSGKRVLYLVYDKLSSILLVAITDKKTQQATINEILVNLDVYKEYVLSKIKEIHD